MDAKPSKIRPRQVWSFTDNEYLHDRIIVALSPPLAQLAPKPADMPEQVAMWALLQSIDWHFVGLVDSNDRIVYFGSTWARKDDEFPAGNVAEFIVKYVEDSGSMLPDKLGIVDDLIISPDCLTTYCTEVSMQQVNNAFLSDPCPTCGRRKASRPPREKVCWECWLQNLITNAGDEPSELCP
jgi:hypothetical protein